MKQLLEPKNLPEVNNVDDYPSSLAGKPRERLAQAAPRCRFRFLLSL